MQRRAGIRFSSAAPPSFSTSVFSLFGERSFARTVPAARRQKRNSILRPKNSEDDKTIQSECAPVATPVGRTMCNAFRFESSESESGYQESGLLHRQGRRGQGVSNSKSARARSSPMTNKDTCCYSRTLHEGYIESFDVINLFGLIVFNGRVPGQRETGTAR